MTDKTRDIYNATHRHVVETKAGRQMCDYLWAPFDGYIGQLSWATRDQIETLARSAGLGPNVRVLDLCCGTGGIALHLAKCFGCRITGVDYSECAIELAQRACRDAGLEDQIEFIYGNALDLPFPDQSFDAAISVDSLVIVPRRWQVIRELARVLKPGARLAFSDEVVTGRLPRDPEVINAINVYGRLHPQTSISYRRILEEENFRDITIEDTTPTFGDISDRWANAYRRYEEGLRDVLGDQLFDDGLLFFEALRDEARDGALGQIRITATRAGLS